MILSRITMVLCLTLSFTVLRGQSGSDRDSLLRNRLETIYDNDQKYRQTSDWKMVMRMDSVNQIEVIKILEQYGWLGEDAVGKKGSAAIFLVVQHADLPIQEKYLPIMREAVRNGAAIRKDLALLEDRVLMRKGEKQIYGSQVVKDSKGNWIVHPIEDPANVDKRRLEIGLLPIAEYLSRMGVRWDLDEQLRKQDESGN